MTEGVCMKIVFEDEARIRRQGDSVYLLLPETFYKFIEVELPEKESRAEGNYRLAMGQGKHGNFLAVWNVEQQKKRKGK